MSDLFGNHIDGFPTRRLIYEQDQVAYEVLAGKILVSAELSMQKIV